MRILGVILINLVITQLAFSQCTPPAAPTIPAGQTRFIASNAAVGANVGSPIFAADDPESWSIVSFMPAGDPYFTIDDSGQISVLQSLEPLFVPRASVDVTLTLVSFNCFGTSAMEDVVVTVVESPPEGTEPEIFPGQIRQTTTAAQTDDSVGDTLGASQEPSFWFLTSQNPDLGIFSIDNSGQISILLDVIGVQFPGFNDIEIVDLVVVAGNEFGTSVPTMVTVEITRVGPPIVTPGQILNISSDAEPGDTLGSPIFGVSGPAFWQIVSSNPSYGAFDIDEMGQISSLLFLDSLPYPPVSIEMVTLSVVAGNEHGMSTPENVTVNITIVSTARCGTIPPTQTRFISRLANLGDNIGDPIDAHNIDAFWINEIWIDGAGGPDNLPPTAFSISTPGGQLRVNRPFVEHPAEFPPDQVTKINVSVVGHNFAPQCATLVVEDIVVYVLPDDSSLPIVLPGQTRYTVSSTATGSSIGPPILSAGTATDPPSPNNSWSITGGNDDGVFAIDENGQITTLLSLAGLDYIDDLATVMLEVVVFTDHGASDPEIVTIFVTQDGTQQTTGPIDGLVTDATNMAPIVITTATAHNLMDGNQVRISGVLGNTDANGDFFVSILSNFTFELDGSSGNGAFLPSPDARWVLLDGTGGIAIDFSQFINDAALLTCAREVFGLGVGSPISESQVTSTTHLDCSCRGGEAVADLQGIRFFTSLEFLALDNNLLQNIDPLIGLTSLTDLRLAGNLITDITTNNPFASLVNLVTLDLSENQIRDSNAFSTLTNLDFISLKSNRICEISSLVALTELGGTEGITGGDSVILDDNPLNNTEGLNQISQLEATGAFISTNDIFFEDCTLPFSLVVLERWPEITVDEFATLFNNRAPCNDP